MNSRNLITRICNNADKQVYEKSNGCKCINFVANLCLRFFPDIGWGLAVYDESSDNQMTPLKSPITKETISLGETFIWKARTISNDMLLKAAISDGSIHLPILGTSRFSLPDDALGMILPDDALDIILKHMMSNGACVSFDTCKLVDIKSRQAARTIRLMHDISIAEKTFGKRSLHTNAIRQKALNELMNMPNELNEGKIIVELVPRHFSCIEDLEIFLDLNG